MNPKPTEGTPSLFAPARLDVALFLLVLLIGAALRISDLRGVIARTPDERTYAWEASIIAAQGAAGFPALATRFRQQPSLFLYPPPVRAGYLYVLSWVSKVTRHPDPLAGAIFSCAAGILSLLLLGVLAWRLLSPRTALFATLFYAVSPPVLMFARRAWQESVVDCLGLILLALSLEALRSARPTRWIVAAGCLAGLTITVKEGAMIEAALLVSLLALWLATRQAWAQLGTLAAATAIASVLSLAWLAHLFGGLSQVNYFLRESMIVRESSAYPVEYQSGSLLEWLDCFWVADPVIVLFGLFGIFHTIRSSKQAFSPARPPLLLWSAILCAVFLALPALVPHQLNLRFASPLFAPLCLLAGAGVQALASLLRSRVPYAEYVWGRRFAIAVLLAAAFINYRSFQERFVQTDLQDLSLKMMLTSPNRPQ